MRADLPVPTESQEGIVFADWLRVEHLKFSHIANESGSDPYARRRASRMKREGTSPGICDYVILIPPDRSVDGRGYTVWVELKRQRGSTVSPEQREWIAAFNHLGTPHVAAYVARGAREAIELVSKHLGAKRQVELF